MALHDLGLLQEAVASHDRAIQLRPDYAEAYTIRGLVLFELGQLEEAIESYNKVIKIEPDRLDVSYELGRALDYQNRADSALKYFREALPAKDARISAQIFIAILSWINGDRENCEKYYQEVSLNLNELSREADKKFVVPYCLYLGKLLENSKQSSAQCSVEKQLNPLFVIGDSHCLSLAKMPIMVDDGDYYGEAKIVVGTKAWHLGNGKPNQYKAGFEATIDALPVGATVLLLFGEIDCRLDEGILKNHKKTDSDLDASISDVVTSYTSYLAKVLSPKNLKLIVAAVPAPIIASGITDSDKKLLVKVVKEFNLALEKELIGRNYSFLDLYSLSRNEQGFADGTSHIDEAHLYPKIFQKALSELR